MGSPDDAPVASTPAPLPTPLPAPSLTPPSSNLGAGFDRWSYAVDALAVGLLVLGTFWRVFNLEYPSAFGFDEHHFVQNARNYIARQVDWNDHPPLGKLLLVPAIALFGDNGLGWRLSPALLGLMVVVLGGIVARQVFDDRRAGLLAAAFLAMDGFFISYSRVALLDTPLTMFMYAALALMLWGRSLGAFAAAAACVGLAVATKWTGVCIILVAPWLLWRRRRRPWHVLWMFGVAGLIYLVVSGAALYITRQPISLSRMLGANASLLKHHAGFTVWDNAASSRWFTWPFLVHPILLHYRESAPGIVRATTTLGNVLLWFAATGAVGWALVTAGQTAWQSLRRSEPLKRALDSRALFVVAAMVALMLPFMVTRRQSYIFHYLGAYGLALGLLAARLIKLQARYPRSVLAFVAGGAVVSIVYAPLWTNTMVTRGGFLWRLPFPGWR